MRGARLRIEADNPRGLLLWMCVVGAAMLLTACGADTRGSGAGADQVVFRGADTGGEDPGGPGDGGTDSGRGDGRGDGPPSEDGTPGDLGCPGCPGEVARPDVVIDGGQDQADSDTPALDVEDSEGITDSVATDMSPDLLVDAKPDLEPDSETPDMSQDVDPACTDNDPNHCGELCSVCQGATPHCFQGVCQLCNQNWACGGACAPCPSQAPVCRPDGIGCVGCLWDTDCPIGQYCGPQATCVLCLADEHCLADESCDVSAGICLPDAPVEGCEENLDPQGYTCNTAKIIGRKSIAGAFKTFSTYVAYSSANDDDAGNCADSADEEFYRIYLGGGQSLQLELSVASSSYDPVIKIYSGTNCDNSGTDDLLMCSNTKTGSLTETLTFVAPSEGWYSIVVDGAFVGGFPDDYVTFSLKAKAVCQPAHCGCP